MVPFIQKRLQVFVSSTYTDLLEERQAAVSAILRRKPLFACVVTQAAQEERVKKHGTSFHENYHPQELKEFRNFVLTKTVRFWDDPKDIKITVGETLAQFSRREDLLGWVRPHQEANMPALTDEITRLSKENASLRAQLESSTINDTKINGLSFQELLLNLIYFENHSFSSSGSRCFLTPRRSLTVRGVVLI